MQRRYDHQTPITNSVVLILMSTSIIAHRANKELSASQKNT